MQEAAMDKTDEKDDYGEEITARSRRVYKGLIEERVGIHVSTSDSAKLKGSKIVQGFMLKIS